MKLFVKPSVKEVIYRSVKIENNPVNILHCKQVVATILRWYPDNKGLPAIKFFGCDAQWVFETEEERDSEIQRIITKDY